MKRILIAAMLFCSLGVFAQQKIKVSESNEKIGNGSNNALVVTIYEATPEEIEKEWKSLMKDYNAKVSTKDGVFADNAAIKEMGPNTVDVYARTEKVKDKETKLIVAFDLGGAYMSSGQHSQQFNVAKEIIRKFAVKTTKEAIEGMVKAETKVLTKLNDQQKDLVEKQEDLTKDIADWKEKIKKAEDEVVKNKSEQEKKKTEIATQQKVVDAVILKQKAVE
jgi:hypothetical protein